MTAQHDADPNTDREQPPEREPLALYPPTHTGTKAVALPSDTADRTDGSYLRVDVDLLVPVDTQE